MITYPRWDQSKLVKWAENGAGNWNPSSRNACTGISWIVSNINADDMLTWVTAMGILPDTSNWVAHVPGMPGTFSPPPRVSESDMHHGTCVKHVPWCMPGLLTSGFIRSRWRGKRSWHSRACTTRNFTYLVRGPGHQQPWSCHSSPGTLRLQLQNILNESSNNVCDVKLMRRLIDSGKKMIGKA